MYVHIPFCAQRCDYCDFATWTDRAHLIDAYVDACVLDLRARRYPPAATVFFGGGTPSLLPAASLVRILDAINREPGAEVTVECNPDSVDAGKLATYAGAGVNRLSFGVQSMRPHVLAALGRTHDPANVQRAIALAREAGIANLNVDLIYGTPGESLDETGVWPQARLEDRNVACARALRDSRTARGGAHHHERVGARELRIDGRPQRAGGDDPSVADAAPGVDHEH